MSTPDEFAAECRAASKALRRIPRDLKRLMGKEVKTQVAEPLADKIFSAQRGPYAGRLPVRARAAADPTIVIGGSRKVVSGGANPRQLVYGTEFGGGKKIKAIPSRPGRKGYRRKTTNQFVPANPFIFSTLRRSTPWVLDTFADITLKILSEEIPD